MITFSHHANLRRKQRHIPKRWIVETINNPDKTIISYRKRRLYRKRYGDKILEVVAIKEESTLIVVTQYWL